MRTDGEVYVMDIAIVEAGEGSTDTKLEKRNALSTRAQSEISKITVRFKNDKRLRSETAANDGDQQWLL